MEDYKQKRSLRDTTTLGSKKSFVEEPTKLDIKYIDSDDKAKQIICRNDYS